MKELLQEIEQEENRLAVGRFIKHFSCLNVQEYGAINLKPIVSRVWKLIQRDIIPKDILYLSLLARENGELLNLCLAEDKIALEQIVDSHTERVLAEPHLLYNYTIYTKKHWFQLLSSLPKEILPSEVYHRLLYLKLITITNDPDNFDLQTFQDVVHKCNNHNINNEFWSFYLDECTFMLELLCLFKDLDGQISNDFDFLQYASESSLLETASKYLDLARNYENFEVFAKSLTLPHTEDVANQLQILSCFIILKDFLSTTDLKKVQTRLLAIGDHCLQLELLYILFAAVLSDKKRSKKDLDIILPVLKSLIDEIQFRKVFDNDMENQQKLNKLHRMITDAIWRLELVSKVVKPEKCQEKVLYYMLAEPEPLISLCLKSGDFMRAYQVLKIFNLESSPLAKQISYTEKLKHLTETFRKSMKIREIQSPGFATPNVKVHFDEIVEDFFQKNPPYIEADHFPEETIETYPLLSQYGPQNQLAMDVFDLAVTQTQTFADSKRLLQLCHFSEEHDTPLFKFNKKLTELFNEIGDMSLQDILLDYRIPLDATLYKEKKIFFMELQQLYTEFCASLCINETGTLNKDHPSHKLFLKLNKLCNNYSSGKSVQYLQKLFDYLRDFSKVLYIEKDSSSLVSNGKNISYFDLLFFNRSELLGKLLFQQNLDPAEFERHFKHMKLDFLYHVAGNCFPTVNLHTKENVNKEELYPENYLYPPNKTIINYIKKRHWLLALILNEMYKVEEMDVGESRIQTFINYLHLPKIHHLQSVFKHNQIVTALQNEISYQKIKDYIDLETGKQDLTCSFHSEVSAHSLETAEEILEDKLKSTNWLKLLNIVDSIPEKQLKKEPQLVSLRDTILENLVRESFECEYYKYVLRIADRNKRIDLMLENMKSWPEDFCIRCIKTELTRFNKLDDDGRIEELTEWLQHIEHSKKLYSVWINKIDREDLKQRSMEAIRKSFRVCAIHFGSEDQYVGTWNKSTLKSVPSLFLNRNTQLDVGSSLESRNLPLPTPVDQPTTSASVAESEAESLYDNTPPVDKPTASTSMITASLPDEKPRQCTRRRRRPSQNLSSPAKISSVMDVLGVNSWSEMYDICAFNPECVLQKLLSNKQFELLLEFIELHEVSDSMLLCVNEDFLESAFDMNIDFSSIKKLLRQLPNDHAVNVCQNMLYILKNVSHLQGICNYLLKHSSDVDNDLKKISLSLEILSVFSSVEFDQQLLFLLKDPMSIIEVLIMNTKLDKLSEVLAVITRNIPVTQFNTEAVTVEQIDEMLRHYARKSLDFRVIAQPDPRLLSTPEHKLLQSLDSINLDPSAKAFLMPVQVPTKDEWVANTDVIECMCCSNVFFSMFNRHHHCRRCGRVVCYGCSKKRMIVPSYGDILVRVCSDCFEQTFQDASVTDETLSTRSVQDDYWMLTDDAEHNRIVRDEFSYEFAPSVSLCLSLMKLHSPCDEYSKFLLDQCDILLKLLIPSQEPLQEIDYMLVIRMLKSLALAAKIASQVTSLHFGSTSADRILSQAELLSLLAERGCLTLLPHSTTSFIDSISLMRLTDKLLEREQWNLALEVSTKAGIDKSGVFVAWGKSCLKAGCLAMAREKFSKCLDKNAMHQEPGYYDIDSASLKTIKNPPLLNEIVKILESKLEVIDDDLLVDKQRLFGSTMTLNQSMSSLSNQPPDNPIFVLNKLKNLKNIESGYYHVKKPRMNLRPKKCKLDEIVYNECVYYLTKYGTAISLVEFHMKHGYYRVALDTVIKRKVSPEAFLDIYVRYLKEGSVKILQVHMSELDSTLTIWKDYLMHICCHLEKNNFLHSLYQLQQYMGDYVRAAITCIRFYEDKVTSFGDLLNNVNFLVMSLEHFNQARDQEQWVEVSAVRTNDNSKEILTESSLVSPLIKNISHLDIEKRTATIKMQMKVAEFLAQCEAKSVLPMEIYTEIITRSNPENTSKRRISVPTLFGLEEERKFLAVLCVICAEAIDQGYDLALKIIAQFKLQPLKVYKEIGKYLSKNDKFEEISDLVRCIKGSTAPDDITTNETCDEMLMVAVAARKNAPEAKANVEDLIKLISDKTVKISAYIEAKELKTAYFLATKYRRISDIKRIMREADLSNQTSLKQLCQKTIQKYASDK